MRLDVWNKKEKNYLKTSFRPVYILAKRRVEEQPMYFDCTCYKTRCFLLV